MITGTMKMICALIMTECSEERNKEMIGEHNKQEYGVPNGRTIDEKREAEIDMIRTHIDGLYNEYLAIDDINRSLNNIKKVEK
jgi:hypothetical protein